jgi:hypothetical protein
MKVKEGDSIAAFLTDAFGNLLFFDNSGNITTQDKGVPVYQYLRKVTKENNKLKYAGELVAAQDIVNQKILEGK